MAILLPFIPDRRLEDIESVGIGNVIWWHGSPIGDLSNLNMVIKTIRSILQTERNKNPMKHWVYMVLIGNYGGHMAFAMEPPYCVAYSADYKTSDPTQMTPRHTHNHPYAMITNNMIVRRLLSLPHWEPMVRKQTKGGCLLILRGVHFGPALFPEIVVPHNHASPPVDPAMWQEAPFRTVGPFWAMDSIFPSFPGDLELFTAEEVVRLKELGFWILPMHQSIRCCSHHLYPLVGVRLCQLCLACHLLALRHMVLSSHWWQIGTRSPSSLTVTRIVTPSMLTVVQHRGSLLYESLRENRNHTPWNERTRMATGPVIRTMTKIVIGPKRVDSCRVTEQFHGCSPLHRDHGGDRTSNGKCERSHGQDSPSDSCKSKQRCRRSASPAHDHKRSCTPRVDLCRLCPCSIPLLYWCCAGCLLISWNPALHTCPSIRVGAQLPPLT